MKEKLFSIVITALLSVITILVSILGFMSRDAYVEMKKQVATVQSGVTSIESKVNILDGRMIAVETIIDERTKKNY